MELTLNDRIRLEAEPLRAYWSTAARWDGIERPYAPEDVIRKQIMSMVTDTQRILRTDPGRPEVCNVCQMHRSFGDDYEEIWEGERTARTGCVDTKKLLLERILRHYAEPRERYRELMADPARIDRILDEGAERIRPIAQATMAEVREKMGLR